MGVAEPDTIGAACCLLLLLDRRDLDGGAEIMFLLGAYGRGRAGRPVFAEFVGGAGERGRSCGLAGRTPAEE